MKTSMIALAFAAFATAGFAHASDATTTTVDQPGAAQMQQWSPSQTGARQKTRAEVRHELVQAEQDGQLAYFSQLYRGSWSSKRHRGASFINNGKQSFLLKVRQKDDAINTLNGALSTTMAKVTRARTKLNKMQSVWRRPLARIRGIAVERGWIESDAEVSDEAIAGFIFRPGFSTAERVSEVSGRGVGMDAVRDFLKRENGSIELRFTDDRRGAEYRRFQTVVYLPENWAVDSVGVPAAHDAKPSLQFDALSE